MTGSLVGFAGGLNPDTVLRRIEEIQSFVEFDRTNDYWIDMESGVRTDDWLDLDKVEDVLAKCATVIGKSDNL